MLKNFLWAFIEKGGQFSLQFLSVIILSRFLTPKEYGIYGIMAIFISVSELLIDSGFGGALVHKKVVCQSDINTLFISNLGISIFLYLVLFLAAPFISNYYAIPELEQYLRVLGITIIFHSTTIVHLTLLQRELKLKKSANITLAASVVSVVSAVIAAYFGMGIWALIIQPLMMAISLSVILWMSEKRNISIFFSLNAFNELWAFGSKLLIANLLQNIYSNISTSIMPKIANVTTSGYYFQASRINSIPVSILQMTIDKAAFPILSKEPTHKDVLNKTQQLNIAIITLSAPLIPILSLFSNEIISIVLGVKWLNAAPFLQILAWGGWGLLIQALYRNIYKSVGDTKTILKTDIIKTIIGLTVLALSAIWGVTFMIWGLTIGMYVGTVLYSIHLNRDFAFSIKKQLKNISVPLLASLISYISSYFIYICLDYHWYNLFLVIVFLIEYVFLNLILKNEFLRQLIKMIGL